MQVQLNPFLPFGRGILAGHTLHLQHIIGQQHIIALVFIVGIVAAHNQGGARFEALPLGHILAFVAEDFEVDRAVVIGNRSEINLAAVAFHLGSKHIAPDRDLAAVAQVVERAQIGRLERLAVEHLGRLGRQRKPIDRKGRDLFFGFKLHGGNLLGHPAFQGCLIQRRRNILHTHNRQRTRAFLNQFSQVARKLNTFQDRPPGVDPHGQPIGLKRNRLLPVQKTVDRHPLAFKLFNHQFYRIRRNGCIVEVVFQRQLIAGKQNLQGRQKTPAQRRIKRVGAAQADHHLAGGAVQFYPFHHHVAKRSGKLGIGRELRPDFGNIRFQLGSSLFGL